MVAKVSLPDASADYYDAIFTTTQSRLAAYLDEHVDLAPRTGTEIARELLGHTVYPQLFRALFGVDAPHPPGSLAASDGSDLFPESLH